MFFREARILRKLKHPYILPVFGAGLYEGLRFLVVEYAPNGSLADRLDRQAPQPLPLAEACSILTQIAQALQYVHEQDVVHRDLKPANILFNDAGDALLADFGLAITLKQTGLGGEGGTAYYMAPEQFQGEVSKRSDQYALGCIAYELLTGQRPFDAPNIPSLWYQHAKVPPTPLTQLNLNIPMYIEQAVLKAMAKQHKDRYCDVSAFMTALQSAHTENIIAITIRLICPKCGFQNRSSAKFCKRDGQSLIQDVAVVPSQNPEVTSGKSPADWLKEEGDTLRDRKQYQEALEVYDQAICLNPQYAAVYNNKSITLNDLQRYQEVLEAYEQAIHLDPKDPDNWQRKAEVLAKLRCKREASTAEAEAARLRRARS